MIRAQMYDIALIFWRSQFCLAVGAQPNFSLEIRAAQGTPYWQNQIEQSLELDHGFTLTPVKDQTGFGYKIGYSTRAKLEKAY